MTAEDMLMNYWPTPLKLSLVADDVTWKLVVGACHNLGFPTVGHALECWPDVLSEAAEAAAELGL